MDNFNIDIHSYDEDSSVKLYPITDGVILKTTQLNPACFRNIDIELTNEDLEQLRACLDCYFTEREEDKKNQTLRKSYQRYL